MRVIERRAPDRDRHTRTCIALFASPRTIKSWRSRTKRLSDSDWNWSGSGLSTGESSPRFPWCVSTLVCVCLCVCLCVCVSVSVPVSLFVCLSVCLCLELCDCCCAALCQATRVRLTCSIVLLCCPQRDEESLMEQMEDAS